MSGLENLGHLRVLNLAGNCITVVSGLSDLSALTELNLRRNRVTQVVGFLYCMYCHPLSSNPYLFSCRTIIKHIYCVLET